MSSEPEKMILEILKLRKGDNFSMGNICDILVDVMKIAEDHKDKSGAEKKSLVTNVMRHLASQIQEPSVEHFVQYILPGAIDMVIAVDKNHLEINPKLRRWCCF